MSKNLTNLQLGFLTDRIMSALRKNKITEDVKKKIIKQVYDKHEFVNTVLLSKQLEDLVEQTSKLELEKTKLRNRIKENIQDQNLWNFKEEQINTWFDKKIESEINKLLPSPHDIQGDVVLASIQGSKDIIEDILKKY